MAKHEREHEERKHGGETRAEERDEGREEEREHKKDGGGLHERMEMDGHPDDKKGGHVRRPRRARGGKSEPEVNEYNAKGSPEMKEVEDESEDFKRGGHKKRKAGGEAMGEHERHRADKTPRGRHERRAAGGSVYSSGKALSMKQGDGDSKGHEGVKVPSEPG